ncbi:MAG: hypothetical protein M0Q88_07060 [Bacilli bacterium]|nr:hypothetical protein [Bacilli bacterium]
MQENVTHYYPNAMVLFVAGFQGVPKERDVLVASNIGDVKEISSINITRTVRNNPGTFSLELVNTGNKFLRPYDPNTEITDMYNYSQHKKIIATQTQDKYDSSLKEFDRAGTYYRYNDWKTWLNDTIFILKDEESQYKFPLQKTFDKSGNIREMWGYDILGNIVTFNDVNTILNAQEGDMVTAKNSNQYRVIKRTNENFIEKYKDRVEQGQELIKFNKGRLRISAMDRVVIFMSERFYEPGKKPSLIRVFTGVVNSAQLNYLENRNTIQVQGEDVTKYMRLSVINVNPALLLDQWSAIDQTPEEKITIWSTILKGLKAPDIIRLLTLGSSYVKNPGRALNQKIDGIGTYQISSAVERGINIKIDSETNIFYEVVKNDRRRTNQFSANKISFRNALGGLFREHSVHIFDPYQPGARLKGFRPYEISLGTAWSFYQADFKTRREIAYKVAEDTHFVFYADQYGEIWFHPPRFDHKWIISAEKPEVYVIDTESIISFGFIETDENIFSSVYVNTEPDFALESLGELGFYTASFRDDITTIKYGQRLFTTSNPIINIKGRKGKQAIIMYAKSLLQRLLASKYQGQVTITGRAEINPGMPVYIPIRNQMYYVETIDHSLDFGGSFVTTLHLSYGRAPWEYLPEILDFAANDDIYTTDAYLFRDIDLVTPEELKEELKPNK